MDQAHGPAWLERRWRTAERITRQWTDRLGDHFEMPLRTVTGGW